LQLEHRIQLVNRPVLFLKDRRRVAEDRFGIAVARPALVEPVGARLALANDAALASMLITCTVFV